LATLSKHICAAESTIENWVRLGLFPEPKKIGGKRLWEWTKVARHLAIQEQVTSSSGPDELAERIKNGTRQALSRSEDH
jgi:hypothetical protein